jgi:HEAT repeat protein
MDDAKVFDLVDQLLTDDERETERVRKALVALGSEAIPSLGRAILRSYSQLKELRDETTRICSDRALWSEEKIAELDRKKFLQGNIRSQILSVFGSLGTPAIPYLIALFRDEKLRSSASPALQYIGKPVFPAVRPFLRDPDPGLREEAASIMGWLGADAQDAYEEVERLLDDPVPAIRKEALGAIARIDGFRALPALKKLWTSDESKDQVIDAYGSIGSKYMESPLVLEKFAQQVIDDLIPLLQDKGRYWRVANTLTYMAPAPSTRKAIPALINSLRLDPEKDAIGTALSHMQTAAAWPTAQALLHQDESIRKGAERVLWHFTWSGMCDDGVDAEQVYLRRLPSRNRDDRLVACLALKTLGPSHRATESLKILLLKEEDQEVWDAANAVLKSIKPL